MRVLIVDDNRSLRELLSKLLAANGHEITGSLEDGNDLAAAVTAQPPDVVCLDFNLPGKDGLTLLRELHQSHPQVAVVLVTGSVDPALRQQASEAGAAGFLQKPFAPAQIVDELGHVAQALHCLNAGTKVLGKSAPRAVIADDSAALRQLLKHILADGGIEVAAAVGNGREAVEAVTLHKPDLVCLDIDMPEMGGIEALELIHAAQPDVPVMMITASADRSIVERAAGAGARGYLLKPFKPARVQEALRQLLLNS
ncbi:MAG: response regulator [Gammaproteobacteria bacterium]|nr:response regulator [Gammaproteobacteria bacterium]MBU1645940.1 response regulator [Gammaproteobacteria bacterium]MBU1972002.1 response regulator [Gammaproteobacteria bacterium]